MAGTRTFADLVEPLIPEAEMAAFDARRLTGESNEDSRRVYVLLHAVLMMAVRLRQSDATRHVFMRAGSFAELLDDQLCRRNDRSLVLMQVTDLATDFLAGRDGADDDGEGDGAAPGDGGGAG